MAEIRLTPSHLDSKELLTDILLFEQKWDHAVDIHQTMARIVDIVVQVKSVINVAEPLDDLTRLNGALDYFYLDLAFSSTTQNMPESLLNSISYLINFHTGECLSMSIVLNYVLTELGFNSSIMVIEHEIMVQVMLADNQQVIIDAVSGEQHTHVSAPCASVLPSGFEYDNRMLDKMSLMQIFLTQQKLAFTDEHQFDKALCCIELLIKTTPDDPYQRRDRGFLLHQLDCFNQARDDFEFFIDQCPEDPAAQLLKIQLEEFEGAVHTVH